MESKEISYYTWRYQNAVEKIKTQKYETRKELKELFLVLLFCLFLAYLSQFF